MTPSSHPEPPDVDDAEVAVHAVLDDEATPAQRRLVARDPRLVARVEELRHVAAAVADVPPPPPSPVLDRLRAVALDAATTEPGEVDEPVAAEGGAAVTTGDGVATPPAEEGDAVTPLAPRRAARARRRWPALPAVAAAILVLVAIGVGLIVTDGGGDDEAATDAASEAAGDLAAPELDVQGSYPSQDALREALEDADATTLSGVGTGGTEERDGADQGVAEEAPASGDVTADPATGAAAGDEGAETDGTVSDPAAQRCDTVLRSTDERIGPAQAAVVVEVDGTPLLVLSNPVDDGAGGHVQLTVLDATSCVPQLAVRR